MSVSLVCDAHACETADIAHGAPHLHPVWIVPHARVHRGYILEDSNMIQSLVLTGCFVMNVAFRRPNAGVPAGARQLTEAEAEELRLRTRQALLALGMLVSGTANTLTCKATLSMVSAGGTFDHPFVMSGCMFSGEILCLLWFRISSMRGGSGSSKEARAVAQLPKQIFALPAICDIVGHLSCTWASL